MSDQFTHHLDKYAEVIIKIGVNLQPGQRLYIRAPIDLPQFTRALARQAYLAGSKYVYIGWSDAHIAHIRLKHGSDESLLEYPDWEIDGRLAFASQGDAWIGIHADDPDLMRDVDPTRLQTVQKIAAQKFKPLRDIENAGNYPNGAVICGAMPGWAKKVFPDMPIDQAVARLWDAIFDICRIKTPDPVAAWQAHSIDLKTRMTYLQDKRYTTLHYRGPGTDLKIGLPEGHLWSTAYEEKNGIPYMYNFPTDEVYTLPHKDRIDGTISSTKPLAQRGMYVDDLTLTFENGRVTNATARTGEAQLRNLLDIDEGARSLGEIALVPHSAPISQSGILFYNTLLDENASCHIALGSAYRSTLQGGEQMDDEAFAHAGGNNSNMHVDFMVGSNQLDIDGITATGDTEPVMRAGEWAFDV